LAISCQKPDREGGLRYRTARTVNGIYEEAQLLERHPEAGYKYEPESSRAVRILLYTHYRITYLIKPDGNIDILGVFHGALDIDRYLR